jgi:mannitol-specific phosphotransferase system IIBC component
VTAGRRYLAGLAAVGTVGAITTLLVGPGLRAEVAFGLLLGFLIQAPLGWWTVRSIGSQRFQLVWVVGMVIRLAVVAIAGLILAPQFQWRTVPVVAALVATLLVLLLVEAVTALREHSGTT